MNIIKKLIQSDGSRPTRFHTQDGQLLGVRGWTELPLGVVTWFLLKASGRRINVPWWVFGGIRFVKKNLRPGDCVLEDGSGMSSLWLARRCSKVISIEESAEWRRIVEERSHLLNLNNLEVISGNAEKLVQQLIKTRDFNVIVIDGLGDRLSILKDVLAAPRLPRMIIYDNTDRKCDQASKALGHAAGYDIYSFRGFAPTLVNATETSIFIRET